MQYHLDTIPVWEAMEQKPECPLCALRYQTEQEEIERTLGAGVMEPDVRIRFNERGASADRGVSAWLGEDVRAFDSIGRGHGVSLLRLGEFLLVQQRDGARHDLGRAGLQQLAKRGELLVGDGAEADGGLALCHDRF